MELDLKIINNKRAKLFSVIAYFVKNTKHCHKTKLFKLLYLLDFTHFEQTGKSVTGLNYYAWKMGPVPKDLNDEFSSPKQDFANDIKIEVDEFDNSHYIVPQNEFNEEIFTKRELRILNELSEKYHECYSKQMVNVTHEEGKPWDIVYNQKNQENQIIDYKLSLIGSPTKDAVEGVLSDLEEVALES